MFLHFYIHYLLNIFHKLYYLPWLSCFNLFIGLFAEEDYVGDFNQEEHFHIFSESTWKHLKRISFQLLPRLCSHFYWAAAQGSLTLASVSILCSIGAQYLEKASFQTIRSTIKNLSLELEIEWLSSVKPLLTIGGFINKDPQWISLQTSVTVNVKVEKLYCCWIFKQTEVSHLKWRREQKPLGSGLTLHFTVCRWWASSTFYECKTCDV